MSSISRGRNGLMALSVIGGLLSWVRFKAPRSQDRTLASATLRDPSLATNYRESGLVLRCILPVLARSGGGRLTLMSEVKGRGSDLAFRPIAGRYLVIVIGCTGSEMER